MIRTKLVFFFVPLAAAFGLGCPGDLERPERFSELPACRASIDVPTLLATRCGSALCHGGGADSHPRASLDLTSPGVETRLVNRTSCDCPEFLRVDPNDPDRSFLLAKLIDPPAGCGVRMPLDGFLTQDELACVRSWIHEIAASYQPEDAASQPACEP